MPIDSIMQSALSPEESSSVAASTPLAAYVAIKIKKDKFADPKALALSDVGRFFNDMKNEQLELSIELHEFKQAKSASTLDVWIQHQKQRVKHFLFGENNYLMHAFDNTENYYDKLITNIKTNSSVTNEAIENAFTSAYIVALTYPWMEEVKEAYRVNERILEDYIVITEEEIDGFIMLVETDNDVSFEKLQEIALDMSNLNKHINTIGFFSATANSSSSSSSSSSQHFAKQQ